MSVTQFMSKKNLETKPRPELRNLGDLGFSGELAFNWESEDNMKYPSSRENMSSGVNYTTYSPSDSTLQ